MLKQRMAAMASLFLFVFWVNTMFGGEYHVDESRERLVKFISDAPLEDFEGVTEEIDGYVYWAIDSLTPSGSYPESELYFEVRLDALDTGIDMRNSDMREDYLETDKYPYAKYKAEIVEVEIAGPGGYLVETEGEMTIHGVTREMSISAEVTRANSGYRVRSSFSVLLPDFEIDIPKFLFMRVDEKIELELDYYVVPAEEQNGESE